MVAVKKTRICVIDWNNLLTEGIKFVETDGTHAFVLGNAPCVEYMAAVEQPNFFLVVEPRIKQKGARVALLLVLANALRQVVQLNVSVSTHILDDQRLRILQNAFEVTVALNLVLKSASELLILHSVALFLQELDDHAQVDVLAHLLHKVLVPDDKELFEGHSLFKFCVFFAFRVGATFEFLVDKRFYLEDLFDGEKPEFFGFFLAKRVSVFFADL